MKNWSRCLSLNSSTLQALTCSNGSRLRIGFVKPNRRNPHRQHLILEKFGDPQPPLILCIPHPSVTQRSGFTAWVGRGVREGTGSNSGERGPGLDKVVSSIQSRGSCKSKKSEAWWRNSTVLPQPFWPFSAWGLVGFCSLLVSGSEWNTASPSNSHAQSGSIATAIPPRQCIIFGCWVAGRQVPSHLGVPVIGLFWVTFDRLSETRGKEGSSVVFCFIFLSYFFIYLSYLLSRDGWEICLRFRGPGLLCWVRCGCQSVTEI